MKTLDRKLLRRVVCMLPTEEAEIISWFVSIVFCIKNGFIFSACTVYIYTILNLSIINEKQCNSICWNKQEDQITYPFLILDIDIIGIKNLRLSVLKYKPVLIENFNHLYSIKVFVSEMFVLRLLTEDQNRN